MLWRLAGRENAIQIRGASAIKSRGWAADIEARAGESAEGAWKGANPIDPGTQAASETPGEMLGATVPKMTESRRQPHSRRTSTRQQPATPSFGFPGKSQQSRCWLWHGGLVTACGSCLGDTWSALTLLRCCTPQLLGGGAPWRPWQCLRDPLSASKHPCSSHRVPMPQHLGHSAVMACPHPQWVPISQRCSNSRSAQNSSGCADARQVSPSWANVLNC